MSLISKFNIALMGGLGSISQDIVLFYSKRFSTEPLVFSLKQYIIVSVSYFLLAAFVAVIFPYTEPKKNWKPFAVGVALPAALSLVASAFTKTVINPLGTTATYPGTLLDLLAWF